MRWVTFITLPLLLFAGCARFQPRPISAADSAASLETRTLDNPALKEFFETNSSRHFETWPPKSWDFEMLGMAAYYYNPGLDVARAQWAVARGGRITAAQSPNPTLNAIPGYDITAPSLGISPWIPAISYDQPIETAGKRGYRMAQARELSESARLDISATAWQVRATLRARLIDFTAAQQRRDLLGKQEAIEQKIVQSLEQQLEAGAIASSDLTLVRIALAKLRLDLNDARQQAAEARAHVAEAIGVPLTALDGLDLQYDLLAKPPEAASMMAAEARDEALRGRADVLAALADYAASQSALRLEIAKQYPDIHLGPGYQYNNGDHQFFLSLTAELPVLNQNQGPIAEATARRVESAARFTALQAKIIADIDRAVALCHVSQDNLAALESLADSQKKQLENVQAQSNAGAASQFDVLNAQAELAASQLVQLDGRVRMQQAFAALEDAIQRPLDAPKPPSAEQPPRALATQESYP